MERIDRKFNITAVSVEHGRTHTHDDAVLFLAKDKALPATLEYYYDKCLALGADERQLKGIALLIERVERWQREYPKQLKVADVDTDTAEGDQIVAPNEPE